MLNMNSHSHTHHTLLNKNFDQMQELWDKCLEIFRDNLDEQTYKAWFEPIKLVNITEEVLTIMVPSPFFYEYLEEKFIDLIKFTLRKVFGPKIKLEYKVPINSAYLQKNSDKGTITFPANLVSNVENEAISIPQAKKLNPLIIPGIQKIKIETNLKKELNFEKYIEGKSNKVAVSIGKQIAQKPGQNIYNPFFIHGLTGVGKTHLVNAIGLLAKDINPNLIVLYENSLDFQNKYQKAVQEKTINEFIQFYKQVDILIIDDVQDLTGKEGTQKVFFNIFNILHQANKQIIFTSDRPPVDLTGFFDRLLTRFKWGMTAEIEPPDFEMRLKILKQKAYENGCNDIPEKVFELIAENVFESIRELEGILLTLTTYATVQHTKINIELAKKVLKNLIKERQIEYQPEEIISRIAEYFNLNEKVLKTKSRKREIVIARHLAMYYIKQYTKLNLRTIGEYFGGKDHSTVLYALKAVEALNETDKEFRKFKEDLDKIFYYNR